MLSFPCLPNAPTGGAHTYMCTNVCLPYVNGGELHVHMCVCVWVMSGSNPAELTALR